MTKHNARQFARRRDPLVHPGATSAEMAIGNAIAPFDRAVRETEIKWGIDRLPELVSPESAAKWGSAVGKLNAAIDSGDVQEVTARVGVCLRGLTALDTEARAAGHQPIAPDAWEVEVDGVTCAILRDDAAWPAFAELRPGVRVYSLREVANAPGEKIYPGELAKGLELVAAGTDIDYVGATSVELVEPGESAGVYREVDFKGGKLNVVGFR